MIKFRYNGEPVGKGRPRVTARGGKFAHAYTPKKTKDFENDIRFAFNVANCEKTPVYDKDASLVAELTFAFEVPKSYSKKRRAACLSGEIGHTKKPDIDNVVKSVLDALEGGAFESDASVIWIFAEKKYAEEPYVDVKICEAGEYELR